MIDKRLIAQNAILNGDMIDFDADLFIQRLLIFDLYILESIRLKEVPYIINLIGYEGFIILLKSEFFKIRCEAKNVGEVGQLYLRKDWEKRILDFQEYSFSIISSVSGEYLSTCFKEIKPILNLEEKKFIKLKSQIAKNIISVGNKFGNKTQDLIHDEIKKSEKSLKALIKNNIYYNKGILIEENAIKLYIESLDKDDILIETNLNKDFNIFSDEKESRSIVSKAALSIIGTNLTLETMEEFNAKTYLNDKDIFHIRNKFDYLVEEFYSEKKIDNFTRVLSINNHAKLNLNPDIKIDIEVLLKIRDSSECRNFREWLNNVDKLDDEEIKEYFQSYKHGLSIFGTSVTGRTLRFLTSTGLGLLNAPLGVATGIMDSFILDKLIPKNGVITFLQDNYPRIFKF